MSVRTILICVLALVFGASAAAWVNTIRLAPSPSEAQTVAVVVAAKDVPRFATVTADMLTTRPFPEELVPPGSFTSVEDAKDRVAVIPITKGEPILNGKLGARGAGRGMAAAVPPKMRAFTIQTPNVSAGVAGFILPGNKVDVLLTLNDSGNDQSGGGTTTTLLQNTEILAVDQRVEAPTDNKVDANQLRSVTLLVTPDDAARLNLGQNKGTLHLSLRNYHDKDSAHARPATVKELRVQVEKEKPEPPKPPIIPAAVEIAPQPAAAPQAAHTVVIEYGNGTGQSLQYYSQPDGSLSRKGGELPDPKSPPKKLAQK